MIEFQVFDVVLACCIACYGLHFVYRVFFEHIHVARKNRELAKLRLREMVEQIERERGLK